MQTNKMNSIQYLRGLCALSVFFSHVPCFHISNGQIGVAFFMIISAFFSMYSTDKNPDNVLLKKIIKIIPLYWLLTICIYIITLVKPSLLFSTAGSISNLIKSLFFIPYNANNIFGHGPLLNVGWFLEIDIYYMVIFSIFNRFFYKKRFNLTILYLFIMFIIGRTFEFDLYILNAYTSYCLIYYIIGLILYKLYKKKNNLLGIFNKKYLSLINTILFFCIMYFYKHNALYTFIISVLFLLFIYNDNGYYSKKLVGFGNVSFPFYLIHYFVIAFFDRLLFEINTFNLKSLFLVIFIFCITVYVSYILNIILKKIEQFIKDKLNLTRKKII